MDSKAIDLLNECERIAKEKYDGHFTLMRFTTNWKFCFGQPFNYDEIQMMATGKTMEEAIQKGIKENTNAYLFFEKMRKDKKFK